MKFKPLALAAALALPLSLAFGADLSQTLVLTPDNGSFSAGLTATHLESAFFVDTFSFELPAMQTGMVTAEFFSTDPNLDLLFGFLEGEGYFFDGLPGAQTASVTGPGLSGLQTVSVSGTAPSSLTPSATSRRLATRGSPFVRSAAACRSRQEDIGQARRYERSRGVLGQAAVAHLAVSHRRLTTPNTCSTRARTWDFARLTIRSSSSVALPLRTVLLVKSCAPGALAWIEACCAAYAQSP